MQLLKKVFSMRRYNFLLNQLVSRDFKVRYRGSVLGVLWSALNPLLNMIVLSIVFSQVFRAVDNYKMYLLAGLTIFNYFSEATNIATSSVIANFGLITKVYFPKFILPLSKTLSSAINLVITATIFLFLGCFMDVHPWIGYLMIPYVLICVLLFTAGMSFIVAASQVFFRDTQHLYGVLLTIWMYATPILYPIDVIPQNLQTIFEANPLYIFIDFLRQLTLYSTWPEPVSYLWCALWGIGMFVVGGTIFVKTQNQFIYYE